MEQKRLYKLVLTGGMLFFFFFLTNKKFIIIRSMYRLLYKKFIFDKIDVTSTYIFNFRIFDYLLEKYLRRSDLYTSM